jgi:hypothetical protein
MDEVKDGLYPVGATRMPDGRLYGWTGRDCPRCEGTGQGKSDDYLTCKACGGTGDEFGPIDEA